MEQLKSGDLFQVDSKSLIEYLGFLSKSRCIAVRSYSLSRLT
ncbi:MAG: hypothetical protein ACQZ3N_05135 [cyanobacterium endosymbiont of Rhopalodia yunnanensis]